MPSPTGIFTGLSQSELDDLRSSALDGITSGRRTSLSGGGKSGSKEWQMTPQEVLREVVYAKQQSGARAGRVSRVYQDFTGRSGENPVVNQQV